MHTAHRFLAFFAGGVPSSEGERGSVDWAEVDGSASLIGMDGIEVDVIFISANESVTFCSESLDGRRVAERLLLSS